MAVFILALCLTPLIFWPDYECPTVHHIIEWRYAGDVNMDGKVDIGDAVTIIRYIFPGYQKAAR